MATVTNIQRGLPMKLQIRMNDNGLKTATVIGTCYRASPIQTNGNLPYCHRLLCGMYTDTRAINEALSFVKKYGTDKQKNNVNKIV
jgi:hypothetical protein